MSAAGEAEVVSVTGEAEVQKPFDFRTGFFYSFGNLAQGLYNGINNGILGLYVASLTGNPFIIGYLGNTRTIEGVVIQPLVGRWSDRTTNKLGRRRPFILMGIPVSVAILLLIPFAHGASHNLALPLLAVAIVLFSITWNIAADPYQALMIDITPERRRGRFNAILSIAALVGQVAILVYASVASLKKNNIPNAVFWVAAALILLCFALVFFGVREPRSAATTATVEGRVPLKQYVADLRRFTQAQKLLVSILFLWTGLNPIITWLPIFAKRVFHQTDSRAIIVYAVTIVVAGICAYPWGKLAIRFGSRNMIAAGTLLLIGAAVLGLVVPSYVWLFPVAALGGMGFSATTVLTFPYLSTLVPGSKMGVFTGLQAAVSSIAVPLSVVVTGVLIDHFGLRSIFAVLIVTMVLDLAFLLRVNESIAQHEVRRVEDQQAAAADALQVPVPVAH